MPRDAIPDATEAEAAADAAQRAHDLRDAAHAGRPDAGPVDEDETATATRQALERSAGVPEVTPVPDPRQRAE